MKRNKTFDITRLIAKNLIKYLFVAITLSFLLTVTTIKFYTIAFDNKIIFDDIKIDIENYDELTDEYLRKKNSGIEVINSDLKVIYSKGNSHEVGYKYRPSEYTAVLNYNDIGTKVQKLTKTLDDNTEINIILKQEFTKENFKTFLKTSFMAFSIILVGTVLIYIISFAFLSRSVHKPIKANLDIIRDHIAKTPYDKTKADLSKINLKEIKSVMWAYNHMLDEMDQIRIEKNETIKQSNQLVANLSHDLKSPITTLKGYSELLMNEDLTDEERNEYIQYVNNSANSLGDLVDLLFDQVKFQHSDFKMNFEMGDLNDFLREVAASYYTIFENKGFNINIDIDEGKFITDFDTINKKRVFTNLFDNIINHNLTPTDIEIKSFIDNDRLCIEIKDDGIGIDDEIRDKIFEPLFQGDKSRTNGNAGLGLFLTKQIIEKHNGQILLGSDKYYKTVFKLVFPKKI